MPRFEAALPEVDIARPWFHSIRGLTQFWVARTLRHSVASGLQAGFANYGRALEAWVLRVLSNLQRRFDSRADGHRAQLARLMNRTSLSADERATLEGHLAELESLVATEIRN